MIFILNAFTSIVCVCLFVYLFTLEHKSFTHLQLFILLAIWESVFFEVFFLKKKSIIVIGACAYFRINISAATRSNLWTYGICLQCSSWSLSHPNGEVHEAQERAQHCSFFSLYFAFFSDVLLFKTSLFCDVLLFITSLFHANMVYSCAFMETFNIVCVFWMSFSQTHSLEDSGNLNSNNHLCVFSLDCFQIYDYWACHHLCCVVFSWFVCVHQTREIHTKTSEAIPSSRDPAWSEGHTH